MFGMREGEKITTSKRSLTFFAVAVLVCLDMSAREVAAAPTAVTACRTISVSGSYILTKNLTVPASSATGNCLILAADNITLDLDGWTIKGKGDGTGYGIFDNTVARRNLTIRNGTVTNFGWGIYLGGSSHEVTVERMRVIQNTRDGIVVFGANSLIKDNIVSGNGSIGIYADGEGSLITGNVANNNGNIGIYVNGCPSNLIGNMATGNPGANLAAVGAGCTRYNNNPAP